MKTCTFCSTHNADDQSFCGGCGQQLREVSKKPSPPTEDAFNYKPLIRTLQIGLAAPAIATLGALSHSEGLVAAGGLLLVPFGIVWIVFTWMNLALVAHTDPVACRNLKAVFWLTLLAPMIGGLLASAIGWLYLIPALALDITLVYWRDKLIGGKFPSQVAIYKLGLELAVIVLPTVGALIAGK
jgi:hypothetical protein